MKTILLKMILQTLEEYSEDLGNNSCDDYYENDLKSLDKDERKTFLNEYYEWQKTELRKIYKNVEDDEVYLSNIMIVNFLINKFKEENGL